MSHSFQLSMGRKAREKKGKLSTDQGRDRLCAQREGESSRSFGTEELNPNSRTAAEPTQEANENRPQVFLEGGHWGREQINFHGGERAQWSPNKWGLTLPQIVNDFMNIDD